MLFTLLVVAQMRRLKCLVQRLCRHLAIQTYRALHHPKCFARVPARIAHEPVERIFIHLYFCFLNYRAECFFRERFEYEDATAREKRGNNFE